MDGTVIAFPVKIAVVILFGAATMAAQTANLRSDEIHEHLYKASEYLKNNASSSAAKELEAVLALDPNNAEAYANLGVIAFFQHAYRESSSYLQKALKIDPSLTKTEALLGLCERRLGDSGAQARLEKSFSNLQDKGLQVQVGLELSAIYYQEGELDLAASIMRTLVNLEPENIEILFASQRLYFELAGDTLNKLAILAPGSARMQQVIAERLINDGDLKNAIEHYRRALQLQANLTGVHYELAEAILEVSPNDPQSQNEAERELDAAVKLDGDSASIECVYARIASRRLDLDSAYLHYSRALILNPSEGEANLGLGRMLAKRQKPEEASKYLRKAIESDPLNGEAHYRLAMVCKTLQLNDEAAKELRLFQEIKETKKQVRELYRQMNSNGGQEEQMQDPEP